MTFTWRFVCLFIVSCGNSKASQKTVSARASPREASPPRRSGLRDGVSLPATGRQYGIFYPHEESVFMALFTFPVPGIGF